METKRNNYPTITKERAIQMLQDYISYDAEAADSDYLRKTLQNIMSGEAKELGLG